MLRKIRNWVDKCLDRLVEVSSRKPEPFRLPNRYELAIVAVIAVVMFVTVPKFQAAQREKEAELLKEIQAEQATSYEVHELPVAGVSSYLTEMMSLGDETAGTSDTQTYISELAVTTQTAANGDITDTDDEFTEVDMFTVSTVNVHDGASKSSNVLVVFPDNTIVTVIGQSGNWSKIEHDGGTGWICTDYLREYDQSKYLELGDIGYFQQDLIRECLAEFDLDVDEYFIYGLIYTESRFDSTSTSCAEAMGVMQVTPGTWKLMYSSLYKSHPEFASKYVVNDGYDTNSSIVVGMYTLKAILSEADLDSLENNASRVLTTYNRGEGNAYKYYKNNGTYSTGYSQDVLRAAEFIRDNKYWKEGI